MYAYRRLTDNDTHIGRRIDIGERHKEWRPIGVSLESGDDEYSGCSLLLRAFGWTVRLRLPAIIKPYRQWIDTSKYEWSRNPNGGYWDQHAREYGFSLHEGFLQVFLGPQTHDSLTTKSWSCHLPWTQLHFCRHSFYGLEGEHLRSWTDPRDGQRGWNSFDEQYAFKETMPKVVFAFTDYDGEAIEATTLIEEREYTFGEGRFQWLRFFRRGKTFRSLDIRFSKEVGPEKGSWKGGTVGHSIEMLPGELHEAAFRRYCEQEHSAKGARFKINFVGKKEQA